ncbi:MAG: dienelactone hydrolase family protein [Nitrospinae bacterium]|nr:dienelactone hydrolase family protein [Nitrospinota bacterium]
MRLTVLAFIALLGFTSLAGAKVVGKEVSYKDGETTMKGYIAWDDAKKGPRPGVLVVHEWWGHNEYARHRADMLAKLGYVGMALDMYGDGKTVDHPEDASKMSSQISSNMPMMKARFIAALKTLNEEPTVDKTKNAAIGYCFGGSVVLNMAREGADLSAVAAFHSGVAGQTKVEKGKFKPIVLVANGADDKWIDPKAVEAFKKELDEAGVNYNYITYPGAVHGFTNPAATGYGEKFHIPLAYNEKADKESWAELVKLLKTAFGK